MVNTFFLDLFQMVKNIFLRDNSEQENQHDVPICYLISLKQSGLPFLHWNNWIHLFSPKKTYFPFFPI